MTKKALRPAKKAAQRAAGRRTGPVAGKRPSTAAERSTGASEPRTWQPPFISRSLVDLVEDIDSLVLNPDNLRQHTDADLTIIRGSIEQLGQQKCIVARDAVSRSARGQRHLDRYAASWGPRVSR